MYEKCESAFKLHVSGKLLLKYNVVKVTMFMFTFSMALKRTIEHMQMTAVAACDWSVAGKSHARFDLDIHLLAYSHGYNIMTLCYLYKQNTVR